MKILSILKLGDHNENKRVWIANRNILKSGFRMGDRINISYNNTDKFIEIHASETGSKVISGRGVDNPIIDIKNASVAETLGCPEKVEVVFYENRIVISVAKSEQKKNQRQEKTGMKMFDLFAGSGSLTHFFKEAGYQSVGGLEMEDKYLAVFDANNPDKDVVTLCGAIEDIDPSDYPTGVDLVLAGIPCLNYTPANKKMMGELSKQKKGEACDSETLAKRYTSDALVFFVLNAIREMNPRQVVIEEVPNFASTASCGMLRTVLSQWGYNISETVAHAKHTKRQRWCLVGDMNQKIDLTNLNGDDGKTLEDFLDSSIEDRTWVPIEQSKRFSKASTTIGLRSHEPCEVKCNTFTTNGTRSTEPCLKHPLKELYSEFTNTEIARIHGLKDFVLSGVKTLDRQILGQGVADMFLQIALRVAQSNTLSLNQAWSTDQDLEGQLQLFA